MQLANHQNGEMISLTCFHRIAMRRVVIDQIGSGFEQVRQLILEIAKRLDEGRLYERNEISRTIEKILKDKIQADKITEKWIEECLAPEYKRQYTKSEPSSLSKERQRKISSGGNQTLPERHVDNGINQHGEGQIFNEIQSKDSKQVKEEPQHKVSRSYKRCLNK